MTRATEDYDMSMAPAVRGEISETQAGSLAVVAREEAEIKAAIAIAKTCPRNETQARINILKSCDRPRFADEALYAFPRGKGENATMIEGPSVSLARELARCWGNIQVELRIVTDDEERVHIRGIAHDMETNYKVGMEDKFKKLVQRKSGWVRPEERDLRELINRRGAICLRNAILQVLPRDITEEAIERCNATLTKAAEGQMKTDPKATARKLAECFDQVGVTVAMLETYLGHTYDTVNPKEYTKLRGIWQSIVDGNSRADEYFAPQTRQTATVDLSSVQASAAGAAPRASTADSLKPIATSNIVAKRIRVVETGTRAADSNGPKRIVITAEWEGGKGVLLSEKLEHGKLGQEAADTGMLLDASWEEIGAVRTIRTLARTDVPKDDAPATTASGPINLG